jgi:DnaJ-domain-containing protein 1
MRIQSVEPKHLKNWLIIIALLYLMFPRDLIPDFFGSGLGLIDDLSLIAALTYFYRKRLRDFSARTAGESAQARGETHRKKAKQSDCAFDPYQILSIPTSSSQETIRSAYRSRMKEYHPDKVAHLGEELQELAHRKVLEIQKAYQQLTK